MQLTHHYEDGNGKEIELLVTFQIEDHGIGDYEFWGSHGKDVQLVPAIQDIETDDPVFTIMLQNQDFYNHVCNKIQDNESFIDNAEQTAYGNECEY